MQVSNKSARKKFAHRLHEAIIGVGERKPEA
jgi:hypothetical protein